MTAIRAGLVGGLVATVVLVACSKQHANRPDRMQKLNLVTNLWTQIRGWRHEAGMPLDPAPGNLNQLRNQSVREIARICPEGHQQPKSCEDVCSLADAICDNAEAICEIATELGDSWAQEKCASAKASCKEAKQRCCTCSTRADDAEVAP